jgi:hypothetical protein
MKKGIIFSVFTLLITIGSSNLMAQETAPDVANTGTGLVDIGLYLSYILMVIAAIAAIVLPLIQSAGDPRSLMKSGLGLVAILVVFGIAYAISGNEVLPMYREFGVGEGGSKLIGGGLITVYLLAIIALLAIVYTEVKGIFD